jgi:class 3 adenylate cyclase/tetratricopeptide (TPR) repeat protein
VSARERKVITVLFADLVGFTSRSEQLDPEDVAAILRPYHERLRYELERWGGTVEKFIGDAVVAFFGAPVAGENDPERAVRAALAIRDWIVDEGKLEARIAVNTGEALVDLGARPESGEGMATGDVVNTTARLQTAAPSNGILVGETTYRATAQSIEYREHVPVEAKGKEEPVPVWEVVQARARFGVDLAPETRTPLMGRDREVEQLVATLERARRQRSLELITLVGVPGIGKSRLVGELFQSIERGGVLTYWRQGRSLPYGEAVSYWALAEMVKAQAGILETDGDEQAEAKLVRTVQALIEEDVEWVLSHLRPLVGQGAAAGSQEEAFAAWRRFFEALAEEHALVLVFEDIQWADDGLLDFIEHLADWASDVPILILCTSRLELLERRAGWGGGKVNAATIALAPLSDEETARLIWALGVETQPALVERAGGNPLYAEQYVRMLSERGSTEELPETVQGIIAARLDSLPAEEKALLQNAAVVGKVFWLGALSATEQQLQPLRQKEFISRARRSSVEGETEYTFKHLLVRDVAYGQVPRAERAEKHVRTAEWIESLGRPEDHAEMLAHHYASALELARAAGQDVAAIVPPAIAALRDAGDRALTLHALPQAARYYGDALALTAEGDREQADLLYRYGRACYLRGEGGEAELKRARDALARAGDVETAAEASLVLADMAWRTGNRDDSAPHVEAARTLVAGAPVSRAHVAVLAEVARYEAIGEQHEAALEHGREALALAEKLGLDEFRSHLLNTIGTARGNTGDPGAFEDLEESIALAERRNAVSDLVRGYNNLAVQHVVHGQLQGARAAEAKTLELAERFGLLGYARWIEAGAVAHRYLMGEWDEAFERADASLAETQALGRTYVTPAMHAYRGLILLARDDGDSAESDAERVLALAPANRDAQSVQPNLAMAAFILVTLGREKRASEVLSEAIDGLRDVRELGFAGYELPSLTWVALTLGRLEELREILERDQFESPWVRAARAVAAGDFGGAAAVFGGIGALAPEAFYRLQAGTEPDVRAALDFYRRVRATRYIREGEALLAVSA